MEFDPGPVQDSTGDEVIRVKSGGHGQSSKFIIRPRSVKKKMDKSNSQSYDCNCQLLNPYIYGLKHVDQNDMC
jgi:hypothetical protein